MSESIRDLRKPKIFMKSDLSPKLSIFLQFVNLAEHFVSDPSRYAHLIHPDAVFTEYPNLVTKKGQIRTLSESHAGLETAKKILSRQHYAILESYESGDTLIVEALWTGAMAIDAGHLKKGEELKAHICFLVQFRDGKIFRQRNYDCYEPFA